MTKRKSKANETAVIAAAAVGAVMMHAEMAVLPTKGDDATVLDNLLDEIGDTTVIGEVPTEIIETAVANDAVAGGDDEILESIEEDADVIAARQAVYAAQKSDTGTEDGEAPQTSPDAVEGTAIPKKAKKVKLSDEEKAQRKADREAKAAAAKAAKPARATSITHKPGALVMARLGANWRDTVVLRLSDERTGATAKAQDEFIARMDDRDAIADKVKDKILMLFTWLAGSGGADALNEVLRRTFNVLHAKGELTSGDKGNLQLDLLAKPYSMGTARSQANQAFMALPELGICIKEKGRMIPNPDSALLPAIYAKLGLATV